MAGGAGSAAGGADSPASAWGAWGRRATARWRRSSIQISSPPRAATRRNLSPGASFDVTSRSIAPMSSSVSWSPGDSRSFSTPFMASTVSVRSDRFDDLFGERTYGRSPTCMTSPSPFSLRTAATSESTGDTCLIWPSRPAPITCRLETGPTLARGRRPAEEPEVLRAGPVRQHRTNCGSRQSQSRSWLRSTGGTGVPSLSRIAERAGRGQGDRPGQRGTGGGLRGATGAKAAGARRGQRHEQRQEIRQIARTIRIPAPPHAVERVEAELSGRRQRAPPEIAPPAFPPHRAEPAERRQARPD